MVLSIDKGLLPQKNEITFHFMLDGIPVRPCERRIQVKLLYNNNYYKYVYEKYIQNDVTAHYGIIYVMWRRDEVKLPDMKDVNYANIAGTWRLSEWNGEKIDGDTRYYYIKFDRKEKDGKRSYTIYTNLNSATSQQIPGSFYSE